MNDKVPPHTDAMLLEPLDSRMSETTRHGVGEFIDGRDDGLEAAFGQGAVADLAAAGAAIGPAFADAERREIVIEHEFLADLVGQAVDALLVAGGAQRGGDQGLRFAAGEQGGAVRARQDADFAGDGPQILRRPAVDAFAFEDQVANDAFFEGLEGMADLFGRVFAGAPLGDIRR